MKNIKTNFIYLTILIILLNLTGCASIYVDNNTKEINSSQFRKLEPLHPTQLLFEFQTKGVANAPATNILKNHVIEQVKNSGLFSSVTEEKAEGGAVLSITLNNVPITDDAFSKGFVTGLTFGLAGSEVSDGYVCTVRYIVGASNENIIKQARHAIHATMGVKSAPANATKAASMEDAAILMTRQVISNVLNDLSYDDKFK